jgi:hypothetical protein
MGGLIVGKAKTKTLWAVHSCRDGERVCGPFTKQLAERERKRLEREQLERRGDSPIRLLRITGNQPEPAEREVLRELAIAGGHEQLAARLSKPPAPPPAAEVNVAEAPTTYELREVTELAGFDPHSDEPHDEQRARLAAALEEG